MFRSQANADIGLRYEEIPFGQGPSGIDEQLEVMLRSHQEPGEPAGQPSPAVFPLEAPGGADPVEDAQARVAGNLAMGLARVLVSAIRELENHSIDDRLAASTSFKEHQNKLDATMHSVLETKSRIEEMARTEQEHKETSEKAQQELWGEVATLRQVDAQHQAAIEKAEQEAREQAVSFSDRMEALFGRLDLQQEEVNGLKPEVAEISPRVTSVIERLDRQAGAIRAMCESETQRESAVEELIQALRRLKQPAGAGTVEGL